MGQVISTPKSNAKNFSIVPQDALFKKWCLRALLANSSNFSKVSWILQVAHLNLNFFVSVAGNSQAFLSTACNQIDIVGLSQWELKAHFDLKHFGGNRSTLFESSFCLDATGSNCCYLSSFITSVDSENLRRYDEVICLSCEVNALIGYQVHFHGQLYSLHLFHFLFQKNDQHRLANS